MRTNKSISRLSFRPTGSAGFGLVEVMIAAAMISIIALGIGTLIDDMMKAQKKTNTSAAIGAIRARIIAAVQNGETWTASTADATRNPNMGCMRPGVLKCNGATPYPLSLKNAAGDEIYYGEMANHGFTYDGVPCKDYPNNACVFRWNLTWTGICPGTPPSTDCRSPAVTVNGVLEYSPGALTLPGGFNTASYKIEIRRGTSAIRSDPVTLSYVMSNANGENTCLDGAPNWRTRKLNRWWLDPGGNLLNKGTGQNLDGSKEDRVELRAGTYNCRIQSPAFKNGGNRLRLVSTSGSTVSVQSAPATAAMNGGSAVLLIETTLILDTDTTFQIEQRCDYNPDHPLATQSVDCTAAGSTCSNTPAWSLGVPVKDDLGGYGSVTYTTVACTRTS